MVRRQASDPGLLVNLRPASGLVSGQRGPARVSASGIRAFPTGLSGVSRAALAGAKAFQEKRKKDVNTAFLELSAQFADAFDDPEAFQEATKGLADLLKRFPDLSPTDLSPVTLTLLKDIGASAYGPVVARARARLLEAYQPANLLNDQGTALRMTPNQIAELPAKILQEELERVPDNIRALIHDPTVGPIIGGAAIQQLRSFTSDRQLVAAESQAIQQANELIITNKATEAAQALVPELIALTSAPSLQERSQVELLQDFRKKVEQAVNGLVDDARDHALPRNAQLQTAVQGFLEGAKAIAHLDYDAALSLVETLGDIRVKGFGKSLQEVPLVSNQIFLTRALLARRAEEEADREARTSTREDIEYTNKLEAAISSYVVEKEQEGIPVDAALQSVRTDPRFEEFRANPLFAKVLLEHGASVRRQVDRPSDPEALTSIELALQDLDIHRAEALLSANKGLLNPSDFGRLSVAVQKFKDVGAKLNEIPEFARALANTNSLVTRAINADPGLAPELEALESSFLAELTDQAANLTRAQIVELLQTRQTEFSRQVLQIKTRREQELTQRTQQISQLVAQRDPAALQEIEDLVTAGNLPSSTIQSLLSQATRLDSSLSSLEDQVVTTALNNLKPILEDQGLDPEDGSLAVALRILKRDAARRVQGLLRSPGPKTSVVDLAAQLEQELSDQAFNRDTALAKAVDDAQRLQRLGDLDAIIEERYPESSDRSTSLIRKRLDGGILSRPSAFQIGEVLLRTFRGEAPDLNVVGVPIGALRSGSLRIVAPNKKLTFRQITGVTDKPFPVDKSKLDIFTPVILSTAQSYVEAVSSTETADPLKYTRLLDEAANLLNVPIELRPVWKAYQLAWNKGIE